jgi:hypothetical protein
MLLSCQQELLKNYTQPLMLIPNNKTSSRLTAKYNFFNYTPNTQAQIINYYKCPSPHNLHVLSLMQELSKLTKTKRKPSHCN